MGWTSTIAQAGKIRHVHTRNSYTCTHTHTRTHTHTHTHTHTTQSQIFNLQVKASLVHPTTDECLPLLVRLADNVFCKCLHQRIEWAVSVCAVFSVHVCKCGGWNGWWQCLKFFLERVYPAYRLAPKCIVEHFPQKTKLCEQRVRAFIPLSICEHRSHHAHSCVIFCSLVLDAAHSRKRHSHCHHVNAKTLHA